MHQQSIGLADIFIFRVGCKQVPMNFASLLQIHSVNPATFSTKNDYQENASPKLR